MSTSTTCNVYWTNIDDVVSEVDAIKSTCDSTLTSCTLHSSNGGSEDVKCDSQLRQSSSTNYKYAQYFCACGGNAVSVPSIVSCTDKCYTMNTNLKCNYLTLSTGFTVGSPINGVLQDQCLTFRCTSDGTKCTTDGTVEWTCDNNQYDAPGATSTKSYVCNCKGNAQIPSIYQSNGQTSGQACAGGSVASQVSSPIQSLPHTTTTPVIGSSSTTPFTPTTTTPAASAKSSTGDADMQNAAIAPALLIMLLLHFLCL